MKRISLLSESVKKKIAAGEVIEGPFSVIKELIENSLDAGATEVDIQVADSGLKRITVRDDGSGIYREDLKLAIAEHATSKIRDIHDIENISSYGFRGEALSSISSVSELTILSRSGDEEMGGRLVSNSEGVSEGDYAGPSGTTVIIENLFYNMPARKKFLKSRRSEQRSIREHFLNIALAAPGTGFTLDVDGKRHITLTRTGSHDERIVQVYGREVFDGLYSAVLQDIKVKIRGYFSMPGSMKPSRSMQILYINNRPVEYKYLGFLLSRAYEGIAIKGLHPAAFIFIEIDPALIDVNIHPAKREVKLFDQKYIDTLILKLIGKALGAKHTVDPALFKSRTAENTVKPQSAYGYLFDLGVGKEIRPAAVKALMAGDNIKSGSGGKESLVKDEPVFYPGESTITAADDYRIMGVAFGSYIIFENGDSLTFIDFHAAHERIIYDSLLAPDNSFESQALVFPAMIELTSGDYHLVMDHRDEFTGMGFDIDDFSDNTIMVRAVPEISGNADVKQVISGFVESIRLEDDAPKSIREKIAASVACHAARRSGDRLGTDEMRHLVDAVISGEYEARCPHGRPFVYSINKNDLERIFKRK